MKCNRSTIAVGHVGLNVSDIEISKVFYQEIFGLTLAHERTDEDFRYACLGRKGRAVLTLWEHNGGRYRKHRPGLHHLAFEALSIEELNRTRALLENLGIRCRQGALGCSPRAKQHAIYFEDPDGIRIEVYCTGDAELLRQDEANTAA
jgi:catechol-2,3-dioxygenase